MGKLDTCLRSLEGFAQSRPDHVYLVDRLGGRNTEYTYRAGWEIIERVAKALSVALNGPGHKVSILSPNRAHWTLVDNGILRSGNVTVPLFCTMTPPVFSYAIEFTQVDLLFVGDADNWQAVKNSIPERVTIVALPGSDVPEAHYSFEAFLALGARALMPPEPDPDLPCTIVFTSGTTGFPKGVLHSLRSLYNLLVDIQEVIGEHHRLFSYLPMAHGGDRFLVSHQCSLTGGRVTFNAGQDSFIEDLRAAAPTFLLGVPRIWEKLSQGVVAQFGGDAMALTHQLSGDAGPAIAAKIRQSLGLQDLRFAMTSTAPTAMATKVWWQQIGIELKEGYAQTEILPISMARAGDPLDCGVGRAAPGVEIRIDPETGEILARGEGMSLGYYNNPEKNAEAFAGGWVHTGDKGSLEEHGYLHVTGRVSEIVKTAKGKYVAPAPIENSFAASPLVVMQTLYAYGMTQPIMLCCLSETAPADKATVEAALSAHVRGINAEREKHEHIGGLIVSTTQWSAENGILTHTMKVKRDAVEEVYRAEIDQMNELVSQGERSSLFFAWV